MAQLLSMARSTHVFGSAQSSLRGQRGPQMARSRPVVTMMAKPGLHPQWHTEAKVLCNGEEVLVTSGTKPSYTVDVWSGNHPFYQGNNALMVSDEGRVNRFQRRFAGLDSLGSIAALSSSGPAADLEEFKAAAKAAAANKKKGKKK